MTGNRLLLIDSDPQRATEIADQLELLGYAVARTECGMDGHKRALAGECDLVLLDVDVTGRDARLICQSLRAHHYTTPVIVLGSGLSDEGAQTALDAGADAVVLRPFRITLLAAWIRALLRRNDWFEAVYFKSHKFLKIGDLSINIERRTVTRAGEPIDFSELEFSILLALARSAGHVVKRGDLINEVWGDRAKEVYDDAVNAHVRRIRQKLELDPAAPSYIRTSHRNGYLLAKPEPPPRKRPNGTPSQPSQTTGTNGSGE